MRNSDPIAVYLRAAAGTSPVGAGPPAATYRGQVHQLINPFLPGYSATFCQLLPRSRPFQAGQGHSASRSVITISDLDRRLIRAEERSWHTCPGKRPPISADVQYSPRCSMSQEEYAETCPCGLSPGEGSVHPRARPTRRPPEVDWLCGVRGGTRGRQDAGRGVLDQRRVDERTMKLGCLIARYAGALVHQWTIA